MSILIKTLVIIFYAIVVVSFSLSSPVYAVDATANEVCAGIGGTIGASGDCDTTGSQQGRSLPELAALIINIFSWVVGAVAVIMLIYAGFRYITGGGDDNSIKSAKNTILYAVIGLVVVVLSQVIVNFVLNQASTLVE